MTDEVQRLRAEVQRLRSELASRDTLLGMLENSLDGVWDWRIPTGEDYLSLRWKQMLGYDEGELPDTVETWQNLLAPGELERAYAAVQAHWDTGEPYSIVLEYRHKQGHPVWMLSRGHAVRGPDGEWARMAGTHTNVTHLRRAAEDQRQLTETVLEQLTSGVIVANPAGEFVLYNRAAAKLTGIEGHVPMTQWSDAYGLFELDGQTKIPVEDLPLARAMAGEEVADREMIIRNPNLDGPRWLSVSGRPLPGGYAVVVFTDTTESNKAREALEESNHELERFAYVASHDLQEPLRKISSFCQLLADNYEDQLDDTGRRYLEFAVDGAQRMKTLIQDLLAYSRAGSDAIGRRDANMADLAASAVDNLYSLVTERGAKVELGPMPTIAADPVQVSQVFQNLIANGIKFSNGEPVVRVGADKRGTSWVFRVADNGIGIEGKHRDRIFDLFQRLHGRSEYGGTGIGLSICHRIVQRHGGRIWVESEPGNGSTFFFTLGRSSPI